MQELKNAEESGEVISLRSVAKDYGILESTLRRRIKNRNLSSPTLGCKPIFSKEEESELVEHAVEASQKFSGITPKEFRSMAFNVAQKYNKKNKFNKGKRLAGYDWLKRFKARNPILSIRSPEATSLNRIQAFCSEEVETFFTNLDNLMTAHKFLPSRIYNMDETGVTNVHKPQKVLAPKGQKQVASRTSGERGKTTTIIACMSASGIYLPPMFIFARARNCPGLKANAPLDSIVEVSPNGWSNDEKFLIWLKFFISKVHPNTTNENKVYEPVLLIMDNHESHRNYEAIELCLKYNIHLLTLPPHTSHRIQPLDVSFFGPFKKAYNTECDGFMKKPSQDGKIPKITPYDIPGKI